MRKKLKLACLLAPLAAVALLTVAGNASAATPGAFFEDPQDTNVPYVAWVGEKVRLVKCVAGAGPLGDFALMDWSGTFIGLGPQFFPNQAQSRPRFAGTGEQVGRGCYDIDVASEKPGLAKIKLETQGEGANITHDFLVIWMTMNQPVLDELGENEIPGLHVGDPAGDGNFAPIFDAAGVGAFHDGYFQIDVTGSFPLANNYAGDLPGDSATLPRDWEALALLYGHSKVEADDPSGWDIHDDQTNREGHVPLSFCGPPKTAVIDAVDNCLGGGAGDGSATGYSRLVGGTSLATFNDGPFDPLRPARTYMPDGKVDAGDANMPALRIDVAVSGGFGALATAQKNLIYSRNGTGAGGTGGIPANNEHNLYAPFYSSFIPATAAEGAFGNGTSSGVTGTLANNFPGFSPLGREEKGLYFFWQLLNTTNRDGWNLCNDVGGSDQVNQGVDAQSISSDPINKPRGVDSATVYTDEHGEAIVKFLPDVGVTLAADSQGLCDLGEISSTPRVIATATISAQAELPFQQPQKPIDAVSLTKRLHSLAGKSLDCVPKSAIEAFCVETIRDIRGNPVEGAPVAFSREPLGKIEGAFLPADPAAATYVGPAGDSGFNTRGSSCWQPNPFSLAEEIICRTNALGQAGIVVKSTLPGLVDIDAENIATRNGGFGVQRVRCLRFAGDGIVLPIDAATCAGVSGTTPPGGSTLPDTVPVTVTPAAPTGGGGVAASVVNPAATVVSLAGNPVPASAAAKPAAKPAAAKATASLRSAKLVVVNGKRYLVVRASGTAKVAKLRITLVMRTGKVMKPVVRTVRTGKAVRVANLSISKHVRTVRVAVVVK